MALVVLLSVLTAVLVGCCRSISLSWWFATTLLLMFVAVLLAGRLRKANGVCVLVLGDIGRSPRMQYHALSFARHGIRVHLLGYRGSTPRPEVMEHKMIKVNFLPEGPSMQGGGRLVKYMSKVFAQVVILMYSLLFSIPRTQWILMQTPPGMPAVGVAVVCALIRGSQLIIDWHNYGDTLLALSLGSSHPLVCLYRWYEKTFALLASGHLCVTRAMCTDLQEKWNIRARTMYDRPPAFFQETPLETQNELFSRLAISEAAFDAPGENSTVITERETNGDKIFKRVGRPALIMSSTSWTEDEDFSILLSALEAYEKEKELGVSLPSLLCVITGKGPLKEHYKKEIASKYFKHVTISTPWLRAEDYPLFLGSADLGVCLHNSSSGLDLPMKVVDMFGCALPVCAMNYPCLAELVQHGENGLVFGDSLELAQQLKVRPLGGRRGFAVALSKKNWTKMTKISPRLLFEKPIQI
uniref:chitobiosyldiphosphodolichol beta-mannosyltransferase isoform X2 n=1 Tax=Myxine glutinosa TaxID=7769 RepID=UPI00358FE865